MRACLYSAWKKAPDEVGGETLLRRCAFTLVEDDPLSPSRDHGCLPCIPPALHPRRGVGSDRPSPRNRDPCRAPGPRRLAANELLHLLLRPDRAGHRECWLRPAELAWGGGNGHVHPRRHQHQPGRGGNRPAKKMVATVAWTGNGPDQGAVVQTSLIVNQS